MPKGTVTITHDAESGVGIRVEGLTDAAAEMIVMTALATIQRRMLVDAILNPGGHGIVGARSMPRHP